MDMANMIQIAETLKYQAEIFNVTYEEAWHKYLHPGIRDKHPLAEILPHIKKLEQEKKSNILIRSKEDQRKLEASHGIYRFECIPDKNGYKLKIYKDEKHFYSHGLLVPSPKAATTVIRRVTKLPKLELDWIDNISRRKIRVKPAYIN